MLSVIVKVSVNESYNSTLLGVTNFNPLGSDAGPFFSTDAVW